MSATSEAKVMDGLWLGLRGKSDEDLIGIPDGVVRARTARRLPEGQRWSGEYLRSIRGTPRAPIPGRASTRIPVRPGRSQDPDSDGEADDDSDNDDGQQLPGQMHNIGGEPVLPPPAAPYDAEAQGCTDWDDVF